LVINIQSNHDARSGKHQVHEVRQPFLNWTVLLIWWRAKGLKAELSWSETLTSSSICSQLDGSITRLFTKPQGISL